MRTATTWRYSTILRSVFPLNVLAATWAFLICSLPRVLLPRTSPLPMSLMGTALGLLLVFRTNNSYQRLAEARQLWGKAVFLVREAAQSVASTLLYDPEVPEPEAARDAAGAVCRYLAAYGWELNSKLTYGTKPGERTEVLETLLPPTEAAWMASQRHRPLQLLSAARRVLQAQFRNGNLPSHMHRKLEEDFRELDLVVGGCERLFASPVPPTMSRHAVRCLLLWLLTLPLVLAGTMAPVACALWTFVVSYIFIGIEEVGVQVEQPFEIVPMTQLCNVIQSNLEESFAAAPR